MTSESSPFKVDPKPFQKIIHAPTSKSYGNRLLILAALKKEAVTITDLPDSTDVLTMIECLKSVGLKIKRDGHETKVDNSFPECEFDSETPLKLETGDGGTTNRFLMPFLARGKREYHLNPYGHMKKRPMGELVNGLRELGVKVESNEETWLSVQGPFKEQTKSTIDCSESTQFASGLLMATCDLDIELELTNLSASLKYFELTQSLCEKVTQNYCQWNCPPDFSGLSYPLALGAVEGEVQISNCFERDLHQADSALLEILKKMGASIEWGSSGLKVTKAKLQAFQCDGSLSPDIVPTLAFIASRCEGTSEIKNIGILRHKECDRVAETCRILDLFNISYELTIDDCLKITGSEKKSDLCEYRPPHDHRMVMTSYLFMRSNSGGQIYHPEYVSKSFANFFEVME